MTKGTTLFPVVSNRRPCHLHLHQIELICSSWTFLFKGQGHKTPNENGNNSNLVVVQFVIAEKFLLACMIPFHLINDSKEMQVPTYLFSRPPSGFFTFH